MYGQFMAMLVFYGQTDLFNFQEFSDDSCHPHQAYGFVMLDLKYSVFCLTKHVSLDCWQNSDMLRLLTLHVWSQDYRSTFSTKTFFFFNFQELCDGFC